MTVSEIVSAIHALPLSERRRLVELVAREAADDAPRVPVEAHPRDASLVEWNGLLLVDAENEVPIEAFDHRVDREARADRLWGSSV